ncbi:hypothetical protein J437_LFUL009581 [Ladona fulva]|uniref:Uncharacterized protein n=1 Tax=Ladona fulva TaxID=123851 RepID=A0A8K0K677_LADFU|nr:hypothetical protein J437_LFUL009581 [Ladona fulva]
MRVFVIYVLLSSVCVVRGGLFDWFYYPVKLFTGKSDQTSLYAIENDDTVLSSLQFEADSEYDTFLSEAQSVIDVKLSTVETCQHKVIMKIKSSCASLTEEDLAKLSISLLNCKTSEEGGHQFICTNKMTIEECTREMDSEMWKAFRVMHDQARSLCFSVRQQLFKAMTEMVVNKLMHTSQAQLKSMKVLQVIIFC